MALTDGLILNQRMNSDFTDLSGNGHDETPSGSIINNIDQHLGAGCGEYDGTDDYGTITDHADFTFGDGSTDTPFTYVEWINMTSAVTFRMAQKPNEWSLATNPSKALQFVCYDTTTANRIIFNSAAGALDAYVGSWTQIVATYDGSGDRNGLRVYINNSLLGGTRSEVGNYNSMSAQGADVLVGGSFGGGNAAGLRDNRLMYNRVITVDERFELYAVGAGIEIGSAAGHINLPLLGVG